MINMATLRTLKKKLTDFMKKGNRIDGDVGDGVSFSK